MDRNKQVKMEIRKLLQICGYDVVDIEFYENIIIEGVPEELYKVKLRLFGEVVERIVFKHGNYCLDMLSKNIHIVDMFGKDDEIILPRCNGREISLDPTHPYMNGDGSLKEILFFEDYVSLREHFFERNQFIQMVCSVRTDDSCTLNLEDFGDYKITVMTTLGDA